MYPSTPRVGIIAQPLQRENAEPGRAGAHPGRGFATARGDGSDLVDRYFQGEDRCSSQPRIKNFRLQEGCVEQSGAGTYPSRDTEADMITVTEVPEPIKIVRVDQAVAGCAGVAFVDREIDIRMERTYPVS